MAAHEITVAKEKADLLSELSCSRTGELVELCACGRCSRFEARGVRRDRLFGVDLDAADASETASMGVALIDAGGSVGPEIAEAVSR